jgi:hypothetical protein
MAKQFRHNRSGRRDGEKLQDGDSTPRMNRLEIKKVDYLRFKITQAEVQSTMNMSTQKSERQVLMQYMKAAHRWSIS